MRTCWASGDIESGQARRHPEFFLGGEQDQIKNRQSFDNEEL